TCAHALQRTVYGQFKTFWTTTGRSHSCWQQSSIVNNSHAGHLTQRSRQRQIDNCIMFVFDSAPERQYQRPSGLHPGTESYRYIVAQDKQARRNENVVRLPRSVLGDEIYRYIATPQCPIIATYLIIVRK